MKEKNKHPNFRHGRTAGNVIDRTYNVWRGIKSRCLNTNYKRFKDYGGRGITVCDRWLKFDNFLEDMGEVPNGRSIDRIDNNKGYYKENCRWATPKEQSSNTRDTVFLTYKNETLSVIQWSRKIGINAGTLRDRIHRGWSIEKTLSIFPPKEISFNGETASQATKKFGKKEGFIYDRLKRGWSLNRAFTELPHK